MQITMLHSKIHRATVTDANLNYVGSITIDRKLLEAAGMRVGQKVDIVNVNNGERFSTYIIPGEAGKREICLNGAAARKVHQGDKIIIIAYAQMNEEEADRFQPKIVILNDDNTIAQAFEGLE
ncbi:aspartate 1-decarboxylase [Nitratifractor salsuginis]|uniref:Aspartate 1-decarboxylase n=1 Tax=Nitratifractor salsuginis (strain DSM 16511 / JCM 12458 / E9I37-1) TaxID=749222 RepID=E6WYN7_NITSE|nr:aspartate 1-decarboxylase [Nitratifractor salsuginis]ADV45408.1 L-aspartate 1-decarboxylase [Nitratifractor salsuginis DSM 16511]